MRIPRFIAVLAAATVGVLTLGHAAYADLLIQVDKSTQRMTVMLNGEQLYQWPVSTGGQGYDTPSGTFKPFRMEIDHTSDEYDNAPMPYSMFFTDTGIAVHGTNEARNLGHAVAWLRAVVGEERSHAVGTGETGENGQHQGGAYRRSPQCGAGGAFGAIAVDPGRTPLQCATTAVPTG